MKINNYETDLKKGVKGTGEAHQKANNKTGLE